LDDEGWPHYEQLRHIKVLGVASQEVLLKKKIIFYFQNLKNEKTA